MTTTAPTSAARATGTMVVFGAEKNPPKARLVFRVGVVGRRPNRLLHADWEKLESISSAVLEIISAQVWAFHDERKKSEENPYQEDDPILRVVSSIAEGADRIVAGEALKLGYQLQCPLPFERDVYKRDFEHPEHSKDPTALRDYRDFLSGKGASGPPVCFEMDGRRKSRPGDASDTGEDSAYAAAGRIVVNQSDILIAIWEGDRDVSEAGSFHRIREAVQYRIPVIWIDAAKPHDVRLLRGPADLPDPGDPDGKKPAAPLADVEKSLRDVVVRLIEPPVEQQLKHEPEIELEDYFKEGRPRKNWWFWWKLFRDIVGWGPWAGWRIRIQKITVKDFVESVLKEWPDGGEIDGWSNAILRKHYAWSDKLADINADRYRSSFLLTFFLGALAVFLAAVPVARHWEGEVHRHGEMLFAVLELVAILLIAWLVLWNIRGRWHSRWINYRLVAELIRGLHFLAPIGGPRPIFRVVTVQEHLRSYGDPAETWMLWQVRAIARELGLPRAVIDTGYVRKYIAFLKEHLTTGQQRFHEVTERRSGAIDYRLRWLGTGFFLLTCAAVLVHVVGLGSWCLNAKKPDWYENNLPLIVLACAALPALASALAAIRNQGEFLRLFRRSSAMKESFVRVNAKLDKLSQSQDVNLTKVAEVAGDLSQLMVNEFLDWRVVFKDREVEFG